MPDQDSTCSFDFTPLEKITATLNKASMEGPYDPALNPTPICDSEKSKNVILLIGDGFGWEPTRAGAITIEVLKELEEMGIPATGTTDATKAAAAKAAFAGRTLDDYYTKGRGHGMAHQDLDTFTLMTTSTVLPVSTSPRPAPSLFLRACPRNPAHSDISPVYPPSWIATEWPGVTHGDRPWHLQRLRLRVLHAWTRLGGRRKGRPTVGGRAESARG